MKPTPTTDVYSRISFKAHNSINNLTTDERDALENCLIDSYAEYVTRISDEELLTLGLEKGEIL